MTHEFESTYLCRCDHYALIVDYVPQYLYSKIYAFVISIKKEK